MSEKGWWLCLCAFLLFPSPSAADEEGKIFTLWPLVDYRRSDAVDYTSVSLLGPLVSFESKGPEHEFALRPFYFRAADPDEEAGYSEYLYPVGSRKSDPEVSSFQVLHLLNYDFGARERGSANAFSLFPFVFAGRTEEQGRYFAVFPLGGKIYNLFGRDEIRFALFPLYGRTQRQGTTITNVLWPIFARIEGEDEAGVKVWPLYGSSRKQGVYRKRFVLWPFYFDYRLKQDTDNPVHRRGVFPFHFREDSPRRSSKTWLWPFFSVVEDREKGYREKNLPWPLVQTTEGESRSGARFLPFYADQRIGANRKRWYLWPIYKIEETRTEIFQRRRDRILFFLYSDIEEDFADPELDDRRRVALWPLFTYVRNGSVSRFSVFSLLEPFFPGKEGVERNWAPLWQIYQRRWDESGNEISSLLWNLYWKERRGDDLALEIFPLVQFRREEDVRDLKFLKGLVRWHRGPQGTKLHLFYLPWGIPLGEG